MTFLEQRPILLVLLMVTPEIDEIAEAVGLTRPSTLPGYGHGGRGTGGTTLAMLWATLMVKNGHPVMIVAATLSEAHCMRYAVEKWCSRLKIPLTTITISSPRSSSMPLIGDKVVIDPAVKGWPK